MSSFLGSPPPAVFQRDASSPSKRPFKLLRVLTWVLYAAFIILWFKDNNDPLKKYHISYLVALVPLAGVIGCRLGLAFRRKKLVFRAKLGKTAAAIVLLLVVATAVRWPYIMNGERMLTGDDAIFALMGKHIAGGKLPPICMYGQWYLGSLSSHIYALFFKVFGYSIPVLKFATLLFYLGFMALQFQLLKKVFSFTFSVIVSLLYSLPFGHLLVVSLDNSASFGLVLCLGTALIYMAYEVAYEKKMNGLPFLGFLMGIAFWTHQITASFILVALVLLIFKAKLGLKSFASLSAFAALGVLPLLVQEIFTRFQIVDFLTKGEKGSFTLEKVKATAQNLKALLAPENATLGSILLVLLLLGIAALGTAIVRSKGRSPQWIFLLFAVVFGGMHWFSRFSDNLVLRYLYPAYFCIPVLLLVPFTLVKSKLKHILAAGLVAVIVIADGWPVHASFAVLQRKESLARRQIVDAMRKTGARYWQTDYYWAYVLTAISGETPLVDTVEWPRYYPYRLAYYNQNEKDSYAFCQRPAGADNFAHLLTALGISFKRMSIGDTSLFYDMGSRVFPDVLSESPPPVIPRLTVKGVLEKSGCLEITFRNTEAADYSKFHLNVEIPGYSAVIVTVPSDSPDVVAVIPVPSRKTFAVRYDLDYRALKIPATAKEFSFMSSGNGPSKRMDEIVYLRGVGPLIHRFERDLRDCEREAAFEIRPPRSKASKLRLELMNPINFRDMKWYGRYEQSVSIAVGDNPAVETPLREQENVVEIGLADGGPADGPILVKMKFRYHYLFDYAPVQTIAAFLVKAEIIN